MPRNFYDELTPDYGRQPPVEDEWGDLPDQVEDDWSGLPDSNTPDIQTKWGVGTPDFNFTPTPTPTPEPAPSIQHTSDYENLPWLDPYKNLYTNPNNSGPSPDSISGSMYGDNQFRYNPEPIMGEQPKGLPEWAQQAERDYDSALPSLESMKNMFTVENALRTGGGLIGQIGGGALGAAGGPVGALGGAMAGAGAGGFVGDVAANWYAGKPQNYTGSLFEGAINAATAPIGGTLPGLGAGWKTAVKYALKEGEVGAATNLLASAPRKWIEDNRIFNPDGSLNLPSVERALSETGAGFLMGTAIGGAVGTGNIRYQNWKNPHNIFEGAYPNDTKYAGSGSAVPPTSSNVWDGVDFNAPLAPMPGTNGRLLGDGSTPTVRPPSAPVDDISLQFNARDTPAPRLEIPVTDLTPEVLNDLQTAGYTMQGGQNGVTTWVQPNAQGPASVIPFPQPPRTDTTRLDQALEAMGAGARRPAHNQEDAAWEETPDDALRNGPVGIVQNQGPFSDSQARGIVDRAFPPAGPERQPDTEYGQNPIDQEALQWLRNQDEIIRQNQEQNGPIMGPVEPEQLDLGLNKRTVGRAQRAMRDTVPTDTTPAIEPNPRYPERPFEVQDYQQFLPELYPVRTDEGGTGSSDTNRTLIRLREELGREPTPEELEDAMFPEDANPWPVVPTAANPGTTNQMPQFRSMAEIMTEFSNGAMTRREYEAAVNDYQEREWGRGARDRTRVGGRAAPPDPTGIMTTAIPEIDASNDAIDVESMSRMYDDDIAAARYDGDHERAAILQYLSDYAFDRGSRLRDEEYRNSPPPALDSLTDFWDELPDQSDDIDNARYSSEARSEIDDATTTEEAIRLERHWEREARGVQDTDPIRYRMYRDLASHASDREAFIRTEGRMNSFYDDSVDPPEDDSRGVTESPSRRRHRANVERARQDRLAEESKYTTSPLPVYGSHGNQQTLPGMEQPPLPVIKEGHNSEAAKLAKELTKESKKAQPKIPNLKNQKWWDQKIAVSQETLDAFDKAIAEINPGDLSKGIGHSFARSVLMGIREGDPGIEIVEYPGDSRGVIAKDIIYRAPDRKGVAKATVYVGPDGTATVPTLASDKESGLYGKAVIEIAKELLKLNAFRPDGSYSEHTKNFIKSIREFAVVDESLSKGDISSTEATQMIREMTDKAPAAMGEELDEVMEAAQEAQEAAQVLESPVTTREVADRLVERQAENRRLRIEKGEILGGTPDDNGPGTTIGSIFGGLSGMARNAGWGQGRRPPPPPTNPNQPDYNVIQEALQVPKNMITAGDISAPGRQGLGAITTPSFWRAVKRIPGSLTKAGFDQIHAHNQANPIWQQPIGAPTRRHPNGAPQPSIGEIMGLTLFEPAGTAAPGRRSQQVASRWLEEGIGQGKGSRAWRATAGKAYRASNRVHLAFLNSLTTNLAETLVNRAEDMSNSAVQRAGPHGTTTIRPGLMKQKVTAAEASEFNPYLNHEFAREMGDFIRTATGQAPLRAHWFPHKGALAEVNAERMAGFLNKTIFSSGLLFSRLRLTSPATYVMASPMMRKNYMRSLLGVGAYWWVGSYAMKTALDAMGYDSEINLDWTSSDFGKVRIGNVRIDLSGGHQQFLVNYGRMWAGGKSSAAKGTWQRFGQGFRAETQLSNIQRFMANKLEPVSKFAYDLADADEKNPFHVGDRMLQMAIMLYHQDLYEIWKEDPSLLPFVGTTALIGGGTQIYDQNESVGKLIAPENDWLVGGGGGIRALMPWNWDEEPGDYQGPNQP